MMGQMPDMVTMGMPPPPVIEVAIVEDRREIRESLALLIGGTEGFKCIGSYRSMEEALEWAKRCPSPHPGQECELEIRPVFEPDDFGPALTPELREQEERMRLQTGQRK